MEGIQAAASCYARVYRTARAELLFTAAPKRCRERLGEVRDRTKETLHVTEQEMTLVIDNRGKIVGYTIGNDMSSRDIEGDNPLYLPQAKVYKQCFCLWTGTPCAEALPLRPTNWNGLQKFAPKQEFFIW